MLIIHNKNVCDYKIKKNKIHLNRFIVYNFCIQKYNFSSYFKTLHRDVLQLFFKNSGIFSKNLIFM